MGIKNLAKLAAAAAGGLVLVIGLIIGTDMYHHAGPSGGTNGSAAVAAVTLPS